jgi:uncharacterized membrane protein YhaH (DUF805 family)
LSFVDAIKSGFRNYVNFKGRASRSEFWWWTLFAVLVQSATSIIDDSVNSIASLALLLPGIAVNVRRLHDTNRRGTWLIWPLITLVIGIGSFVLFAIASSLDFAKSSEWDLENAVQGAPVAFLIAGGVALLATLVLGLLNLSFTLMKSDPEMNRFGPPPPPRSLPTN